MAALLISTPRGGRAFYFDTSHARALSARGLSVASSRRDRGIYTLYLTFGARHSKTTRAVEGEWGWRDVAVRKKERKGKVFSPRNFTTAQKLTYALRTDSVQFHQWAAPCLRG